MALIRRHIQISGIINASQYKRIKGKEYKLTEKFDPEKRGASGVSVLVEIRKHGRAMKCRGNEIVFVLWVAYPLWGVSVIFVKNVRAG